MPDDGTVQFRPDLSNHAVDIFAAENILRCFARPRRQLGTIIVGLIGIGMSLMPLAIGHREIRRLMNEPRSQDVIGVMVLSVPGMLSIVIFARVLVVRCRPRGAEIAQGIVTLYTPDTPVPEHQFSRFNLSGARLARSSNPMKIDLVITRHRGAAIVLLRDYYPDDLATTVDVINSMVLEHHEQAFEVVIPSAAHIVPRASGSAQVEDSTR